MWTALSLFTEKEGPGAWCKVELASFLEAFRALGERNLPPEDIPNIVIQQLYEEFVSVKQSSDTETLLQVFQEQVLRRLKLGGEESEVPARLQKQERVWTKLETDLVVFWTAATKKQGPRLKWWLSKLQEHKLEQKRQAEELARMWAEEEEKRLGRSNKPWRSWRRSLRSKHRKTRSRRGLCRDRTRHCLCMCWLISLSWPHLWLPW